MTCKLKAYFQYVLLCVLFTGSAGLSAQTNNPPVFDVHVHFNWDQEELVTAEQVLAVLREHNVERAVVFSTPSANALKLKKLDKDRIIPFFSPYITGRSRDNWFADEQVLVQARDGLSQGLYYGLGEMHLVSGLGPRRDNKIFLGLLALAEEYSVPVNLHTEASDSKYFQPVCEQHPDVRFLWAHAGGILGPEQVIAIIKACPNVWIELSARDPHHYGGLVEDDGKLRANWYEALVSYPERFMIGSDPVWNAHQVNRWYEADEGWLHYEKFLSFHLGWLNQLPDDVADKIRYGNAKRFFSYTEVKEVR